MRRKNAWLVGQEVHGRHNRVAVAWEAKHGRYGQTAASHLSRRRPPQQRFARWLSMKQCHPVRSLGRLIQSRRLQDRQADRQADTGRGQFNRTTCMPMPSSLGQWLLCRERMED